jgi:hypothetical protein
MFIVVVLALSDLFSDAVDIPWWVYVLVILLILWDAAYESIPGRGGW